MILTPQQDAAAIEIDRWLRNRDSQVFRLFGYAGTGKTELVKLIGENVKGRVLYCAPTGKAAHVLSKRGCPSPSTIHSLIYHCFEATRYATKINTDGEEEDDLSRPITRLVFEKNAESQAKGAALIIVDEASMVDEKLAEDLLSFGAPVLAIGDPFQLKPVRGYGYLTSAQPDAMLSEIMRQALDNPILRLSKKIREHEGWWENMPLDRRYPNVWIVRPMDVTKEMRMGADHIISGTHAERLKTIEKTREAFGYQGPLPLAGEKVICYRNLRADSDCFVDLSLDEQAGRSIIMFNGEVRRCVEDARLEKSLGSFEPRIRMRLQSLDDANDVLNVAVDKEFFQCYDGAPYVNSEENTDRFGFGYATTGHKAQGSEWDNVLVIHNCDRWGPQWLYTAVTRAKKRLILATTNMSRRGPDYE